MDLNKFLQSGLLEKYALGLASAKEAREVLRYAKAFPEVQTELDQLHQTMQQYAQEHAIPPPPHLKGKVLSSINGNEGLAGNSPKNSHTKSISMSTFPNIAAVLLISLLAISSIYFYNKAKQQRNRANELDRAYATLDANCKETQAQIIALNSFQNFIKHPHTNPVGLNGSGLSPESEAIVYWNPTERKAILNLVNLPKPPAGKQYQIWADVDGEMIDMGIIEYEPTQLHTVKYIERAASLNITLEPKGGSLHPHVDQLFVNGKV